MKQKVVLNNYKYCPKCDKVKLLDKFHKHPNKTQGVHSICKECKKAYDRDKYLLINKTANTIINCAGCEGKTRTPHKYCRSCRIGPKLPEHFKQFQQEQNRMSREARHRYKPRCRYKNLKQRSEAKGFKDYLDFQTYEKLLSNDCVYCGEENIGSGGGLDRLDNDIGYLEHNVVSCCGSCNQIRGHNLTVMEMIVAMEAVQKLRYKNKK